MPTATEPVEQRVMEEKTEFVFKAAGGPAVGGFLLPLQMKHSVVPEADFRAERAAFSI